MEKQQIVLASRDGGTVSGAAPAFFVILKQQQGNGKADQGILVANSDACALASSVSIPVKPRVKTCLPADCVSGGITVTLDNNSMWNEFYHRNTEMILTKQGRRMFPYCRYWITGLNSSQKYILVMDISPVDNHRYKWNGRWWEPSGRAEPHVLGRVFIHPESPSTGQFWMHQPVSFYKLKLTNNTLDQEGHIILHSMHRYLPRLHLVPANKATEVIQLNGPDVHTFTFPQTEFFAVTAYQNIQITQLKIDYNPFAKGFRDDGLNSRPQRDVKQNNNLELEGGAVFSTPSVCGRPAEVDALDVHQRSLDSSFISQNPSDTELDKESFNAEGDFLGLLDSDLPSGVMPKLKQEVSESPIASSYESISRVASPLDPNGQFNVVIKEEPVDDYDYESNICTQGVTVKQEDTDEETDEYSNTDDDDPIVQKHLMRRRETDGTDGEFTCRKRMLTSPSGVAKAKMLKLDSGKMPVVYLEPCTVTKSTVKISELPQTMLSSCKKDKSPLGAVLDSMPVCFENHKDSCSGTVTGPEELVLKKESPGSKVSQKYCSIREAQWALSKLPNFNLRGSVSCDFPDKEVCGRKRPGILKNAMSLKGSGNNQSTLSSATNKRGRPRKLKISKAGRPPKGIGKNVVASKNASLGPGNILPDVKPDLEDVDGVLFVSFASKEALDINTVDRAGGEESQNLQAPLLTTSDPDCQARIQVLEKELMEELKTLRHKQVIHPSLQEVGLKLNSVDPTMSIDLKYLGVQLPLSYSNYSLWSYPGTNPNSPDTGFSFVSRTGKTNDFTKIKGWRGKLHGASRNEGGSSEGSLKNRSAFCSDKLDEYLENEGKLMETSMGFSSDTPTSPVVYQLPTKSTSYVRTLDSVLKKQSTVIPSTSYTLKPVPPSSTSRKTKTQTRQTSTNSKTKSPYKPILPSPFPPKQKQNLPVSGEKSAKPAGSLSNQADSFVLPAVDENTLPKQISLRQAPQHHQAPRPPGLSKSQVKLMDLEDCALWDGKPRTYITEERADISLVTLLTAQASLKSKPIRKIIRRRAPPCNNDFCRLGCICASLALEKRQPTHCRRPDCMFGCTCLKRRVLLVKGGSKHKKMMKKAVRGKLVLFGTQGQQQEDEDGEEEGDGEEEEMKQKDRKKRKRVEYTICDSEPEQPVRNCPLWVRVEGEVDPEPIYVPTPSVIEPVKSMVLPSPEVWLPSKNRSSSGTKPSRMYIPRPNPVIREEDKDPVYMYFESLMTCARVRAYEPKREEKKQQKDKSDSQICSVKQEHEPELQSPEKATCEVDKDKDASREKSCSSRSEGDSFSTSYVHHTTQGEPTKLIEIISDCNLEEDHNKILTILSQHINSNAPQCLKVGSFTIELASEYKAQDENHPCVCSSRVKISVPSYQDKDKKPEIPVLETPVSTVAACNNSENVKVTRPDPTDKLEEKLNEKLHGGKAQDENHPSVCSSRVKISVPSYQDKDEKPEIPVLETPVSTVAACNKSENVKVTRPDPTDKLEEKLNEKLHGGKAKDENHPSVCSSRVKISVPSYQDKDKKPEIPVLETPVSTVAACNKSENVKVTRPDPTDKLEEKLNEKLHGGKAQDENHPSVCSSRVKISVPSYQDKDEKPEIPVMETPVSTMAACNNSENVKVTRPDPTDKLEEKLNEKLHGGKGKPSYAGVSPAGKLVAYKCNANTSPSGLIQVNDKRYPQAKLLLGQLGALHPANRLAAYITGRLQPTVLDIAALSTVISKVAPSAKTPASGTPPVQGPTTSAPKTTSSTSSTSTPTVTTLKTHVPAQRQIATRPSPGGVFAQFVINKAGALQQKVPGVSTRQAASGRQFLSIKPTPITVIAPVVPSVPSPALCTVTSAVTAAATTSTVTVESASVAASTATTPCQTKAGEPPCSPPAIAVTAAPATPGISTCTTPSTTATATASTTKTTGIVAAVAAAPLPKPVVTPPTVTCAVVTTSTSTVVLTTAAATTPVVTTLTSSAASVPVILSGVNSSPPKREDAAPQAASKTPPKIAPGTDKRVGPRLLLIPVHQTASALRPLNTQVAQRQKMVLQPLRSPGAVNLFRHPNGQIIQLVPLQQVRAAGAQPSVQPVVLRNPGSIVGIRLPAPSKPPESPVSPTSSASSTSPAANSAVPTAVPKLSPPSNPATQASSLLPSVTSFVSQAGTLALRIASSAVSNGTNQTASESKIACSSAGLSATTANLIPLQSGSFALLQLPGQKTVPNSILHHFASLQMKKDYRKICKKEDSGAAQQKENGKAPCSGDTEVTESDVTVPHGKQEEEELSINQSNAVEGSASATATPSGDRNSTALDIMEKNSVVLESSCDDSFSSQHDVSADVISSDHSYISEKPNDEEEKGASEEKEDSVSSETLVEAVSANSVCGSSDQSLVAPLDNAHSQSLENREAAQLRNHGKEQTHAEWEEKPVKEEEEDAQTQMDEDNRASSGQLHSQQQQDTQVKIKEEQSETELFENKQEFQGGAAQPDMERREYKGSMELENIVEKTRSRSEIGCAKELANASGEEPRADMEEGRGNIARQDGSKSEEKGACDSLEEMKAGHDILTHVNSSWSKISSIVPPLENRSEVDKKADTSEKGHFLTAPEQRAHKKDYMPTIDITADDMEEDEEEDEEEEEEDEKTDDSADEMLDGASDFPSEEEIDVEKVDACEYREDDEQVDIETVEELSEKINIARLKATAAHVERSNQKYHPPNSSDETLSEKHSKKHQTWKRKLKSQAEAFAHYRQTHTANERRRRNEMRGLFDKLKKALGLLNLPKVSKCYILKQAFEEIQGLTDQADKFIGQKTLLTRKRDGLIRKVSTLSGKTEEVVLKKLEYIYAKQKATEAQKKKKEPEPQKSAAPSTASTQQEGSSAAPREPTLIAMTNRRGKPLILARRGVRATEDSSASLTLTAASVVMTPQGQVLTLKSPLVPGQVAAVPSTLLQAELKPRGGGTAMATQPGVTSVMIQLPGSTVPVQVKGILTNSTIPITLSAVAEEPATSTVVSATEPHSESEDSFMMPKIVNVTSLAAEAGMNLNLNRNKNSNATAAAGTPASEQSLAVAPLETMNSDNILSEEKAKPCVGDSGGDGGNTTGPKKVFFENKDVLPQLWNVSCTKESPESFSKKLCIGEFVGSQTRRKDGDSGGERLKSKELSFRKLQIKDSRIEMELRKVASAMEEADLDTSEILSSIEEGDDTDETLTSLLNEIAFLNQQLNDDASTMSELPGALRSDFSHKDAEACRGAPSDLSAADGSSFQFGHLGGSFKDLSEVPGGGGSLSPLLLHLEDDDLSDGDKNSGDPSSEADVLKIVIGTEMKNPLSNLSVTSGGNGKTVTTLSDTTNVTPPILQMKTNPEAGNADKSWRPMPKLAPLGLKVASLPVDSEGQSNKVMPLLAPIVAKLAPSGVKNSLPSALQEGQDNKVMPPLAPVVAKLNTTGTLPSSSAGK